MWARPRRWATRYAELRRPACWRAAPACGRVDRLRRVRASQPDRRAASADVPLSAGPSTRRSSPDCTGWSSCCAGAARDALRDAGWWERRARCASAWCWAVGAEWLELWEADALAGGRRVWQPERDVESMIASDAADAGPDRPDG